MNPVRVARVRECYTYNTVVLLVRAPRLESGAVSCHGEESDEIGAQKLVSDSWNQHLKCVLTQPSLFRGLPSPRSAGDLVW